MDNDWYGAQPTIIRTPDGLLVVYVEIGRGAGPELRQLIADARTVGLDAVWVSGCIVDASLGFERARGYAGLEAPEVLGPLELPSPPPALIRDLQISCFEGVWGHVEPADAVNPSTTFVGLHERGAGWIGICEVDKESRHITDAGVRRGFRTADRYTRLVRGAAGRLGAGAVTLKTWGDSEDTLAAYRELGFSLDEYIPGWQLNLRPRSRTLPT